MDLKTAGNQIGKFAAGSAGVVAGSVATGFVPASVPRLVKGGLAIALGIGTMMFSKDQYIRAFGFGIGTNGVLTAVKAATEGQTGMLAQVNSKIPTLGNPGATVMLPQRANGNKRPVTMQFI